MYERVSWQFYRSSGCSGKRDGWRPTHPVQSVAVVPPVVALHQHLSQALGVMWLGAHSDHAALDEGLHLGLADQTPGAGGAESRVNYPHCDEGLDLVPFPLSRKHHGTTALYSRRAELASVYGKAFT